MSHQNLGASLRGAGNRAEAEANFQSAVEILGQLAADFPEVAQYRDRLAWSLISLGNTKRARGDWAEAEKQYRDALAVQTKLAADNPTKASYRNYQANSHWGLAFTLKRANRLAESVAEYREALGLKQSLAAEFPAEISYRLDAANLAREFATLLFDNDKEEEGAKLLPKAIDALEQLASEFPSLPLYRHDLSKCRRAYGKALGFLNNRVEGADQFQKAIELGEKLVRDQPTMLLYQHELGLSYNYFADFRSAGDNPVERLEWYGKALRTLTAVYEQDRQSNLTQSALYKCHEARARTYNRLGKYADALPDWDKVLQIYPLDRRDIMRFQRVDSRLRSGQVAAAIAEVGELSKIESTNPDHWYNFACLYAIASGKTDGKKKDEYADRAAELLKKAVSRGYKNAARMARDSDLDALRDRADFKKLLAELEKQP